MPHLQNPQSNDSCDDKQGYYSGKKDLELALMHLTNNARKETKGGANLIKSWIPVGGRWGLKGGGTAEEHLERLL